MTGKLQSWSIRTHLVLLLGLLALPCIAALIYAGVRERHEAMEEAKRECLAFVRTVASEQQSLIAGAQELAMALALLPEVQSGDAKKITPLLSGLLKRNQLYANILVADKSGKVWASAAPFKKGVSIADRMYFREAVRTGRFSSGEYAVGHIIGKRIIGFGYPVKNASGDLVGVIGIIPDLDFAERAFRRINRLPGGFFTLLDHKGISLIKYPRNALGESLIGRPDGRQELFARMKTGPDEGTFESFGNDNRPRLVAYKRVGLPHESKPYLYIRASLPLSMIASKGNIPMFRNLALLGLVLGAGMFLIWFYGQRVIVKPFMRLIAASERLAAGKELGNVSETVKGGELGKLARAFDGMAGALTQREKALRESEERYRLLVETANEGIWSMDGGHVTTYVNQAMADMLGYAPHEMIGKKVEDFFFREDTSFHEARMRERHSGGDEVYERRFRRRDGSALYTLVSAKALRDSRGSFAGSFAMFTDITERKRTEGALKESEENFRLLFENMTEGVALHEMVRDSAGRAVDYRILTVNPAYARNTGIPVEKTEGALASELYNTGDPPYLGEYEEVVTSGRPLFFDTYFAPLKKHFYISALRTKPEQFATVFSDITEARRAEEALRLSEEKYRTVADYNYDWETWIDPEGRAEYISPSCERITGYKAGDFIQNPRLIYDITHPEDRESVKKHFRENTENPDTGRFDFRIISRTGEERWINHFCQPVYDREGRFTGRRGSNRDVTERRQAEERIKASLREKEVLLKEIHHRVKNNMQVISSLLNMQSQYVHDPEDAEALRASINRIKSMALIHDKLYRSGTLASISLPGYVNDLANELFSTYALRPDIGIDLDVSPVSLGIDDAVPLGLILNELISNSLKHAFPGHAPGTIRVRLEAEGREIRLTVSDNGVGIHEGLDFANTGSLGMQLVVTLVEQLEGTIELKRDKGTEFRITFRAEEYA